MPGGRQAVFFDRDGVLTELVWNPATGEYESPHTLDDLRLCADVLAPLRRLIAHGFDLFLVSNQPSYAKGKTTLDNIQAIARAVEAQFRQAGVQFRETYYCYHHPHGIVPEYTGSCPCRKPAPYFLKLAAARYQIDLRRSWMLGDRDSDIECGQRAGCRTILINHPHSQRYQGTRQPDFTTRDVAEAVAVILARAEHEKGDP